MWGLREGGITLGCGGINALHEALDFEYKTASCNQQHFDLLSGILTYLSTSEPVYTSKHVRGHYDNGVDLVDLDI